ncbi:D-mannonate oxidoreductase [candidate division KSB3 bacterium]|uniref:D-mannonate oxidoreductase n=1 Tax=candidate division KSB3 bacterium TaxID=2044937 RepID=A0A2G6EAW6_9BACT|nr:MAG: D-mannonate oxidoreductase [candidate division KSB3 bacterium]PIE30741.1 MAG: D-mannonate oxidoreductase [candidate division KSB3 bacterium]
MKTYSFDDLKGKVCVITGGGGVIGTSLAKGIATTGAKIAILDVVQDFADKTAAEVSKIPGASAIGVAANVLDKESLNNAKKEINQQLGKIDLLLNCAGGNSPKATAQVEMMENSDLANLEKTFFGLQLEGFQKVFDLNFLGTVLPTMVFALDMLDQGKGVILNVSSMSALKPLSKVPAYSAAKASINNLTEWLATHFAKTNIRVNAIAPGFFLTTQNKFLLVDEESGKFTTRGQKVIDGTPMGRFGDPEELCGTVLYLLSDVSAFVTGVVIPVDGGFNAYSGV